MALVPYSALPTGPGTGTNSANSDGSGVGESQKFTATVSGVISTIAFFVRAGSTVTSVRFAIYTDNANTPAGGTRLGPEVVVASGSLVAGAWNYFSGAAAPVVSGTAYWIEWLPLGGTLNYSDNAAAGGRVFDTSGLATLVATHPATAAGPFTNIVNAGVMGDDAAVAAIPDILWNELGPSEAFGPAPFQEDIGAVIAAAQAISVGQAVETDSPLAAKALKTRTVGLPTEADSALNAKGLKTRAVGLPTETDSALAAGHSKSRTAGQALETDSALHATGAKVRTVGQAVETDSALAATVVHGAHVVQVGQAVETDSALGATVVRSVLQRSTGWNYELAPKFITVGLAVELDEALPVVVVKAGNPYRPPEPRRIVVQRAPRRPVPPAPTFRFPTRIRVGAAVETASAMPARAIKGVSQAELEEEELLMLLDAF